MFENFSEEYDIKKVVAFILFILIITIGCFKTFNPNTKYYEINKTFPIEQSSFKTTTKINTDSAIIKNMYSKTEYFSSNLSDAQISSAYMYYFPSHIRNEFYVKEVAEYIYNTNENDFNFLNTSFAKNNESSFKEINFIANRNVLTLYGMPSLSKNSVQDSIRRRMFYSHLDKTLLLQ